MPLSIQKDDSNILTVTYTGVVNLHERKMAVNSLCELIGPSDPVRLLVDIRGIVDTLSLDEQQLFGEYLAGRKELKNAKVATLHIYGCSSHLLFETYAFVFGLPVVGFVKKNEAIAWLNGLIK